MTGPVPVFVFPGAGGGAPDPALFTAQDGDLFVTIGYPGWRKYVEQGFSADALIGLLAAQIVSRLPQGPICILGVSIGGHFGYATALRLQAMGRDVAGFCAIDSAMIASATRSAGWKGRIVSRGLDLLRRRRMGEFVTYLRRLAWRAAFRLAGRRLPDLLRAYGTPRRLRWIATLDPKFEEELGMRLLIWTTAPWIGSLDHVAARLDAPAVLLRTRVTAGHDDAWRRRCPGIQVVEIPGNHETLFEPENAGSLRHAFVGATAAWRGADAAPRATPVAAARCE